MADRADQQAGTLSSSDEFTRYDQVDKPSYHLAEIADEVGLPAGVFNLVTGLGPVVGEALAAHARALLVAVHLIA